MNSVISRKVAIIDDSDADIELFTRALQSSDYLFDISSANNAYALPRILQTEQPEIVFIDYYLGEETGTNIIESLSAEKGQVDFVIFSSRGDEEVVSEALRAGAADYLSKDELSAEGINILMRRLNRRSLESLRLQSILRVTSDCILTLGQHGIIESCNAAAKTLFSVPSSKLISASIFEFMDNKSAAILKNIFSLPTPGNQNPFLDQAFELTVLGREGTAKDVELVINHFSLGGTPHFTAIIRDVTSRKAKAALLDKQASIIQATSDFVGYGDSTGRMLYINMAGQRMLGLQSHHELSQLQVTELFSKKNQATVLNELTKVMRTGKQWIGELTLARHAIDKSETIVSVVALGIKHDANENGFALMMRDISLEKERERQLRYAATHDPLTGLANRVMIREQIEHAIKDAVRAQTQIALLYLDLDNFKGINDSLGHTAGDEILKITAKRLVSIIRESDLASRLGGDEFVILMEHIDNTAPVTHLAERVSAMLGKPIFLESKELYVTPSIGIAIYPHSGHTADELLRCADSAMYLAKNAGRNRYHFYSKELQKIAIYEEEIKNDLHKALQYDQFFMTFQPIFDVDLKIISYECLLRWAHPSKGLIMPDEFIPIAEQSGLIIDIGRWVINRALADYVHLKAKHGENLRLSINISTIQLREKTLLDFLDEKTSEYAINPNSIILEITESALVGNLRGALSVIQSLDEKGFVLAMDDFGSGYASFRHLQQMPVKILKIDREFVRNVDKNKMRASLISSMISMARALELKTVVEGVETAEEHAFCVNGGVDGLQGFYFSKPMTLKDLLK